LNAVGGFPGGNNDPANQVPAKGDSGLQPYTPSGPSSMMAPQAIAPAGGGQPHNNMQPYLTLNFCIALRGVYPPRT
jgi:microcystin-dependent protein